MKYTPEEMPRGTHYGNNYYEVFSPKLRRTVRLFSNLEYNNYLSLEINPEVVSFCEQPYRAIIDFGGDKKTEYDVCTCEHHHSRQAWIHDCLIPHILIRICDGKTQAILTKFTE